MRVKAVIEKSIMVHIHDVDPGDVLYILGNESDPIIEEVERKGDLVRFIYKIRDNNPIEIKQSNWLDPEFGENVFVHDLRNEREGFKED